MSAHSNAIRHVESLATPLGTACVMRDAWPGPIDSTGTPDAHWLQLSLLPVPRSARGCFPRHWGPDRFERMGALFFLPAAREVRAKSDCREQSAVVCTFRPEGVREWLEEDFDWTNGRLQHGLDLANPTMRWLMASLGEEVRTPGFASEARAELIAAQLAIELGRHLLALDDRRAPGGLAAWRLRVIDERLAEGGDATLAELARLCGLSVRQLARGFRVSRGRSIGDHVARARIARAKRMLAAGECLKAVAHGAGFTTPSNFAAAFRRQVGETPGAYARRLRGTPAVAVGRPHVH